MISTGRETGDTPAIDGDGNIAPVADDGFVTLDVDVHYFAIGGVKGAPTEAVQIVTDALLAGTFTIEACNLPRDPINGPATVSDNDETPGNWVTMDLPTATIATVHAIQTVGAGWAVLLSTLTKAAGVGAAMAYLFNVGARRLRLRADITTPGRVRVNVNAKS
jgi:hypothetical protein